MVAYSFKSRFAEPILAGTKRQTIRADRKRHARPGEEMQLYTGMRTKNCKLIQRVRCKTVQRVELSFIGCGSFHIIGEPIYDDTLDDFARRDGFSSWMAMCAFWRTEHADPEFRGVLITWETP